MSLSFEERTAASRWAQVTGNSVTEQLLWHARQTPDNRLFTFLVDGEQEGDSLSCAQLDRQARSIAAWLQQRGMAGERVLLSYPPGLDFIRGFIGCLYAGAVAVPMYPPRKRRQDERLKLITSDARPKAVFCVQEYRDALVEYLGNDIDVLATDTLPNLSELWVKPSWKREDLAVLQYTSGSTGAPRGVMVSHGNILHNAWYIDNTGIEGDALIHVSWQPFFHDMGLLGSLVWPIYANFPCYLMSPAAFLQKPIRWLRAMSKYRATSAPTPNFGLELCVKDTSPEEREGLDLSALLRLWNGAEPIRADTLTAFTETFAPYGFRHQAHLPCYGMAETTLLLSATPQEEDPFLVPVVTEELEQNNVLLLEKPDPANPLRPSSGRIGGGFDVRIVAPDSCTLCHELEVGEIWIAGPGVTQGYWEQPEETERTFQARIADTQEGPFLRTGDIGFLYRKELFVTGRLKDLIIIRGRNIYPQDVERVVETCHPAIESDSCAAFSVELNGQEGLAVVAEIKRSERRTVERESILAAMRAAVVDRFEVTPCWIALLQPYHTPKTSSGKIRRSACAHMFARKEFAPLAEWMPPVPKGATVGVPETRGRFNETLRGCSPAELKRRIIAHLQHELTVALGFETPPPANLGFERIGVDSMLAVELAKKLQMWLGDDFELPATLLFDQPNIDAIATYIEQRYAGAQQQDVRLSANVSKDHLNEPIAIVGMACRFPGAPDIDAYWSLLREGRDAIGPIPEDRWDIAAYYDEDRHAAGRMYTRSGGFIDGALDFDAPFFDLSPREVLSMDPQQRITLEVAWTALEHAGIAPASLAGKRVGVFMGVSTADYRQLLLSQPNGRDESMLPTGTAQCAVAGRLSYALGLVGPSVVLDTACSSSIVAVHHAMQALRLGECTEAIAGGVNLVLSPDVTVAFCRAGMLSPDGRCKTFSVGGDGYGRGEGCGIVVLKRLSDALRDGNRVLSILRGSAVNQDGRTSGLTAPSGPSQSAVIAAALQAAEVAPTDVQYLECHGTGTPLGDPIEVQAADAVYAQGRAQTQPLLIGSAKSNLGHLEAAAGMAGLLKVVLALQHRMVPPSLHAEELNPHIRWNKHAVKVAKSLTEWPAPAEGKPRLGAVSAFGFVGTNTHAILQEPPAPAQQEQTSEPRGKSPEYRLLALSARSEDALRQLASGYAAWMADHSDVDLARICYCHNTGRNQFEERATLVAGSARELAQQLESIAAGDIIASVERGQIAATPRRVGFLFTGQGAQYGGMGRELYDNEPVFRASIDACATAYAELQEEQGGPSLQALIFDDAHAARLKQTLYAQPAIYALQVALTAQWQAWGIEPVAVVGHSLGEYAAAFTVGAFSAAEGMKLVLRRAQLMETMPGGGAMASVTAPAADVEASLADVPDVCISAYNGLNTVISGPSERLDALLEKFTAQGLYCMRLPATRAFHSATVDPIAEDFQQFADTLAYQPVREGMISTLSGDSVPEGTMLDARHWRDHARQPVRFAQGVKTLFEHAHCDTIIEIGPKAELMWLAQMCWRPLHEVLWTQSLEAGRNAHAQMLRTAAKLHTLGVDLDLAAMEAPWSAQHAPLVLPTYPFQHVRYCPGFRKAPGVSDSEQFFEVAWLADDAADRHRNASGEWLLLTDKRSLALVDSLHTAGHTVSCLSVDTLADLEPATLKTAIAEAADRPEITDVILAWTPPLAPTADAAELQRIQTLGVETALLASQALIQRGSEGRVWILTHAAQAVTTNETADPGQAALWGYARTFGIEHPDRFGGIIDLPADADIQPCAGALQRLLCGARTGLQFALRSGTYLTPRLRPSEVPPAAGFQLAEKAVYLITGGTGALGVDIARHLAAHGARHLVLASRRGESATPEGLAAELDALGCRLTVLKADAAQADEMDMLLDAIKRLVPDTPLRGIVHAAGVLAGEPTTSMDVALLRKVMAGKAGGAWALHRAVQVRSLDLDFFVLFSSAASLLGIRGHANYSAANAFLDGLAHYRHRAGWPAVAINWGPWASHGMAIQMENAEWEAMGSRLMSPALALDAFGRLAMGSATQCCVQLLNARRWSELATAGMLPPVLDAFMEEITSRLSPGTAAGKEVAVPAGDGPLVVRLRNLDAVNRSQALQDTLLEEVGKILGLPPARINPDMGFFDCGMNSIMAVELNNRIQKQLGSSFAIQPVDIFNHPTVLRLGNYLLNNLFADGTGAIEAALPAQTATSTDIDGLDADVLTTTFDTAFGTAGAEATAMDSARMRAALHALNRLRTELERTTEPIAIVGVGCRIPGAGNPEEFWHILDQGLDMITEVPPDRWSLDELYDPDPDQPGKTYARHGGFVKDIDLFDADFFGISPREAKSLDPQQRMVLETTWHALENANIPPDSLRGTSGAVYIGIGVTDYSIRIAAQGREQLDAYVGTGNALAAAAGRVAFRLGWHGPALAIDTACSSSLVAIHEACACLRRGECDHAIAGGVNTLLSPNVTIALSRAHMLSPDGRCKTFDASGNGFVRSEGCSLLVLKRLSDARRDGNRVLAVIRGSSANQDGDSSGLTVPSGIAQEQVIRAALQNAGVVPADVQYLECHGTGTSLGDPIEVQAANAAYARERPADKPLLLGSVKTNVGHLETAAGATGIIKLVLSLQHETIPRSLHFRNPNPHIPWDTLNVKVVSEPVPWPAKGRRLGAISAFGFTGTNCHLILESAPVSPLSAGDQSHPPPERVQQLLVLSARSNPALCALARSYAEWVNTHPEAALPDLCLTANTGRTHLEARAALQFADRDTLVRQLGALAAADEAAGMVSGNVVRDGRKPRIAFLCTGQGSQWVGMGRNLYASEPVFRNVLNQCAAVFDSVRGADRPLPLLQVMGIETPPDDTNPDLINQTGYTQPALYALEMALAALWRAWGIVPDAVLGHSVGEYAAGTIAGVFDIETGMKLITERARYMQSVPAGGCMVAVSADAETVERAIADDPLICIGAYNGAHTVLSGSAEAMDPLITRLVAEGIKCKQLKTSHAFHSAHMDPIVEPFKRYAASFTFNPARTRLVSNVSGTLVGEDELLDAAYWAKHIRQPVRFAQGILALRKLGCDILLEIGPHPVLTSMGQRCQYDGADGESPKEPSWIGSLRQQKDDTESVLAAAGQLFVSGAPVRFDAIDAPWRAVRTPLDLPLYPFQRKRFWVDEPLRQAVAIHPLASRSYRIQWNPIATPRMDTTGTDNHQRWLLIGSQPAQRLGATLEALGHRCHIVNSSADAIQLQSADWTHIAHVRSVGLAEQAADSLADLKHAQQIGIHNLLTLTQHLCQSQWCGRLWIMTQATQQVAPGDRVLPDHAPLWGLGKCIGMERPDFWGGLIDLPAAPDKAVIDAVVPILTTPGPEDLVAVRANQLYAARLVPAPMAPSAVHLEVHADADYLITGGLGGIGLKAAQRLAERGAGRIVLTSRHVPDESARREIEKIRATGCQLDVVNADVATAEGVGLLLQQFSANRPLRGIIHAAGIESFGDLEKITPEDLEKTLAAKVYGSWLLDRGIRERAITPDFFVSTASIASVWGSVMQGAYAAANAYLDAMAAARRSDGLAATAISYGPWAQVGMGVANAEAMEWMRSRGISPLSPELALDAMETAAATGQTSTTIVAADWNKLRELAEVQRPRPIFSQLGALVVAEGPSTSETAFVTQLRAAQPNERARIMRDAIRQRLATVLAREPDELHDDTGFFNIGMDSLMAVEFRNGVSKLVGRKLPATIAMDHPAIGTFASAILATIQLEGVKAETAPALPPEDPEKPNGTGEEQLWPASISQSRFWFLSQWTPNSPQFNLPTAVQLPAPASEADLRTVIEAICSRHDTLRTTFREADDGTLMQVVHRDLPPAIRVVDLDDDSERQASLDELKQQEARHSFSMAEGPLVRFTLVRQQNRVPLLIICMHHSIADGVSIRTLANEFMLILSAVRDGGHSVELPAAPSFGAYARQERKSLSSIVSNSSTLDYWRGKLAGVPSLELPTDRLRPEVIDHLGRAIPIAISAETSGRLYGLARENGITLHMLLLGAWYLLLARYARQYDFAIGTPVAGRDDPEWEDVVGPTLNMLPLRVTSDPAQPFGDLLRAVSDTAREAYARQGLPFDWLVRELNPARDTSRTPFFQTAFVLQVPSHGRQGHDSAHLDPIVEDLRVLLGASQFDIALDLNERNGVISGFIEFSTQLFDPWRIEQMASHLLHLLQELPQNLTTPIGEIPLLSDEEAQTLSSRWNNSVRDYDLSRGIHHLIARRADLTPSATAVSCEQSRLSYRELMQRVSRLTERLIEVQVAGGTLVGISMDRSVDMVVAMLAVLECGAAYVPLDPDFPMQRLDYMVRDSRIPILLTQTHLSERFSALGVQMVCTDQEPSAAATRPPAHSAREHNPDSVAYVIYTSGSTGNPKGVVITHRALLNFLLSIQEQTRFHADDTLVAVTTLSFDISNLEIFLPLMAGAHLVVANSREARDPQILSALLDSCHATFMQATPATWNLLLASGWNNSARVRVLCGGEALTQELAKGLLAVTDTLWNVYGPTETTIWSSICRVHDADRPTVPLGQPLANTTLHIVEENLQPAPLGVPGELLIGGTGLARGYLDRPELTATKFIQDHFSGKPGARLYRTGDLCRRMPDGTIEFLGRTDHQVKVRGFRIELGDVEASLGGCAGVRHAAARTWKDQGGITYLAGYIVPGGDGHEDDLIPRVRRALGESLPAYMVPSAFVLLDALPLTPNRKVDRNALPEPHTLQTATRAYIPPQTATEKMLVSIWQDILHAERLGIRDNFFEIGGHSLLIAQILQRLRGNAETNLSLVELYHNPTIEALATMLDQRQQAAGTRPGSAEASTTPVPDSGPHGAIRIVGYRARPFDPDDKTGVLDLLKEVWGADMATNAAAVWEWKYETNPFTPAGGAPRFVLEHNGTIVGFDGGLCARLHCHGKEIPIVWGTDTTVHPEHRKASAMLFEQIAVGTTVPRLAVPAPAALDIGRATGSIRELYQSVEMKAFLAPASLLAESGHDSLLARLAGYACNGLGHAHHALVRAAVRAANRVSLVEVFDPRFTHLWERVAAGGDCEAATVRDEKYLSWRFSEVPQNRSYRVYAICRIDRLSGYLVTRNYTWQGSPRAMIVDFLVPQGDRASLAALVVRALRDFRSDGVRMVGVLLAPEQRDAMRVLRALGFLYTRGGPHIVVQPLPGVESPFEPGQRWLLGRADSDIDISS